MEIFSPKINRWIFFYILVTLAVSPAIFTDPDDNRNYLLIASMMLGPLIVLLSRRIIPRVDLPLCTLAVCMFITQRVYNAGSAKMSSVYFSFMFIAYFMAAVRVFQASDITIVQLHRFIKGLIIAYAVVLVIQQLCVITGLPVFNQVTYYGSHFKLNSLSAEPSHTACYLGVLMYLYLKLDDMLYDAKLTLTESLRNNREVWAAFLWTMITMISSAAFVVLMILSLRYLTKRNFILLGAAGVLLFAVGVKSEFKPLKRATTFIEAAATGDPEKMILADHSASVRVAPTIICIYKIEPLSKKGWTGTGVGTTMKWMSTYMPGIPDDLATGGMACFALEYGLLVFFIYIVFSLWCCIDRHELLVTLGLWIMNIPFQGFNFQPSWFCLLLLFIARKIEIVDPDDGEVKLRLNGKIHSEEEKEEEKLQPEA